MIAIGVAGGNHYKKIERHYYFNRFSNSTLLLN